MPHYHDFNSILFTEIKSCPIDIILIKIKISNIVFICLQVLQFINKNCVM